MDTHTVFEKVLELVGPMTEENEAEWKYEYCRRQNEAPGRSEGEVALRVISDIKREENRITKKFHAEEITCEAFEKAMRTLHDMYHMAARVWNNSPESAAQGWRA
jgi:hypothetical protein